MRTTEIENQLRQRPFLPFQLRMSDGKAYEVRHPEMLLVSRTIIAVAIHRPRVRESEGIILCDPVHIIRIEPLGDGRFIMEPVSRSHGGNVPDIRRTKP